MPCGRFGGACAPFAPPWVRHCIRYQVFNIHFYVLCPFLRKSTMPFFISGGNTTFGAFHVSIPAEQGFINIFGTRGSRQSRLGISYVFHITPIQISII